MAASVVLWGVAIAAFGVVRSLWAGLALLALAGAADVISSVFRQAILQTSAPEHLQGRLSGTFFAVVTGGPRLGDLETGTAATLAGPRVAVWSGGLACIAGAVLVLWRVPELWRDGAGGRPLTRQQESRALAEAGTELGEAEPPL